MCIIVDFLLPHYRVQEDDFDLMTLIKRAQFYQRGKRFDYVSDYLLPKPSEFEKEYEPHRYASLQLFFWVLEINASMPYFFASNMNSTYLSMCSLSDGLR